MEYLTDEDFEIAKNNGISRKRASQRFYQSFWDRERAITEPVGENHRKKGRGRKYGKWTSVAESNGIEKTTFYDRLKRGWSYKMAATKPPGKQGKKKQTS